MGYLGPEHTPTRLAQNINNGYAVWVTWNDVIARGAVYLRALVEVARQKPSTLIRNDEPLRQRNA